MQIRDIEKLKVWLLKKLQPLCDADPAALSKYIIALLRKEKPRSALKELCINQLEVFLSKETPSFVEVLFRSLDSESYLTGSDDRDVTPPLIVTTSNHGNVDSVRNVIGVVSSGGSPSLGGPERIVTDHRRVSEDIRHREVDDDDRDFRRAHNRHDPSSSLFSTSSSSSHIISTVSTTSNTNNDKNKIRKKIEVDPPRRSIRQRLGNREDERRRRRGPRSRSRSRSSTPDRHSSHSPSTTPPTNEPDDRNKRKRLHNDGGVSEGKPPIKRQRCKDYDERGMCLLGAQCPFDHGTDPLVITGLPPYPPPPPFQLPMPPPPPPPHTLIPKGHSGTDGYNPEDPALTAGTTPTLPPPPLLPQMPIRPAFPPPPLPLPSLPPGLHHPLPPTLHPNLPNPTLSSAFVPVTAQPPSIAPPISNFGGGMGGVRQPSRPSSSIVLRKIPRDMNTITKLSGYFEKFGTIVNLQVRYENDPESATVQFSSPTEAKAAHDCTEAVLNNRFIKVYYLKNNNIGGGMTGGGVTERQQQPYNTGHQHHQNMKKEVNKHSMPPPVRKAPPTFHTMTSEKNLTTPTFNSRHVISNAPSTKPSKAPPPVAMVTTNIKRLELQKKSQSLLESQIQQQKLLLSKLEKGGKSLPTEERDKIIETIKSLSSNINKLKDSLSLVAKAAAVKPHPSNRSFKGRPAPSSPTTPPGSLQAQADQLRIEAHKLGLLPSAPPTAPPPNTNKKETPAAVLKKKAESKSTSLLVVNVEDKDALVKYFESFGGLVRIERDENNPKNVIFTFKNRNVAEKAAKGSLFQGKPLIMKWYIPKLKAPPTPTLTTPSLMVTVPTSQPGPPPPSNEERIVKIPSPPTSLSFLDEDIETELQDDLLISVYTPEHTKPRVVHLLEDEEEEELDERCWRH